MSYKKFIFPGIILFLSITCTGTRRLSCLCLNEDANFYVHREIVAKRIDSIVKLYHGSNDRVIKYQECAQVHLNSLKIILETKKHFHLSIIIDSNYKIMSVGMILPTLY